MTSWVIRSPLEYVARASPSDMKARFPAETFIDGSGNAVTGTFAIHNPDLAAVTGQPVKYWKLNGDLVELMTAGEQAAVDASEIAARLDVLADQMDTITGRTDVDLRALTLVFLDEFNRHADKFNEILDAMDAATSLADLKTRVGAIADYPTRTIANLKTAYRNKLDG